MLLLRAPTLTTSTMYGLQLVTDLVSEPVSVATLKSHLRLNTTDEDSLLAGYITAARQLFETMTDRAVLTQTWKLSLDAFPRIIRLPRAPLQSVSSVQYYDSNDVLTTWSSTNYSVDTQREPGRVVPSVFFPDWKVFAVYPALSYRISPKVIIQFVAGWTACPALVSQAILLLASHYYQRRDAYEDKAMIEVPMGFKAIVNQYKLGWLSNMNPSMFNANAYGYEVE